MNIIEEEIFRENGLNLHIVPSKKYKTINIVVKLRAPISRETITMRALLPYILRKGTKSYPTEKAVQLKLDNLYGAVLSIDGAKKGDNHIISIRLEVANQKFVADESTIIDEAVELLKEMIFHPNAIDGAFNEQIIMREKETLQQSIRSIIDNKMGYANMRLIDEMCKGELYALHAHGYEKDLSSITAKSLYEYYEKLLKEDTLDIYVLGDFDAAEMKAKMNNTFVRENEAIIDSVATETEKVLGAPKEIIEKQDIQQAKLHLGYRTYTTYKDSDYAALQVFNGLFGGFPSSKLFINVREKNSLAYYAASSIESHKGILLVYSGIASEDYAQAREIIELQMTAMKAGEFTTDALNETKELIINQLLETLDHPQGVIELLYQQILANKELSPTDLIENIKEVTKDDVINVAQKIKEDTIYLLAGEADDSDE